MKYFPLIISILFFFLFSLCSAQKIFATAPQITASPSGTINLDQSFTISATMSGLSKNAIYRLRIALAQQGTSNYFGSTFDGANWHYGSINDGNYFAISTNENGSWNGDIQGKVDPEDPNFTTGSGTYDLKLGRYTQTGSTATWSDASAITIYVPPPPTLTPTPTFLPTPTRYPTYFSVTTALVSPIKQPTKFLTGIAVINKEASISAQILGASISAAKISIFPTKEKLLIKSASESKIPFLMIIASGILLGIGAISYIFIRRRIIQNGPNDNI